MQNHSQRLQQNIQRYLRALWGALRLTVRGERLPPPRHTDLRTWIDTAVQQLEAVNHVADQAGLTAVKRQEVALTVDGRRITMETVLTSLHYHLTEEYPYLLRDETAYSRMAIYSSNVNDVYRLSRLLHHLSDDSMNPVTETLEALEALRQYLNTFPESETISEAP